MSVIVAFISASNGVVASDGRQFGSAQLDGEKVMQPASIISEDFDKTFSIDDGRIIGAFVGLVFFSGRSVADHISEIARRALTDSSSFKEIVDKIEEKTKGLLQQIGPEEVVFHRRKIDVLLVGGENLTKSKLRIASLRFLPIGEKIKSEKEIKIPDTHKKCYYVYGEDNACIAADKVLAQDRAHNLDAIFLKERAISAVKAGIKGAGKHRDGTDIACGGHIFTKKIK